MKRIAESIIVPALILGLMLSCGPGNSGSPKGFLQGPYAGSSFQIISGGESVTIQTDGSLFFYHGRVTVTDTYTTDVSGAKVPVPNIAVDATVFLVNTTLQDYSFMIPGMLITQ
jgi:hypothetical protein